MYISKGYIRGIKKEKEILKYKEQERIMRVIMNIALWLLGIVAMLFGFCLVIGVDVDNMLWTIGSIPIGIALCYVAYKCMVWSGFSEPISDIKEA